MADKIKGITIEIGGDTTGLSKALKGVNAEIKNTQSNLKDVNKLLKLDPTNTELLKQKQQLLKQAIGETQEKLKTLKEAEKQAQEQFKRGEVSQEQYDALRREIIQTESKLQELEETAKNSSVTLSKITAQADKISDKTGELSDKTRALSTAAAGVGVAAIGAGIKAISSYADYEQLTGGIKKLFGDAYNSVLADADEAYKEVGMSSNEYMSSVTAFSASLINSLGGDTEAAADVANMAMKDIADNANTFGKYSAEELTNVYQALAKGQFNTLDNLNLGFGGTKEGMQQLIDAANGFKEEMGGVGDLSIDSFADIIEAIHLVQDNMNITGTTSREASETISGSMETAKAAIKNLYEGFGKPDANIQELVGNVKESLKAVEDNVKPVIKTIIDNLPTGAKIAGVLVGIAAALSPVLGFISKASGAISSIMPLLGKVGGALKGLFGIIAANPIVLVIGLIAAAVAGLTVLIVKNWDSIKAWLAEVIAKIKATVENIIGKIAEVVDKVKSKVTEMKDGVIDKIETLKQRISDKFEAIKEKIVSPIKDAKEKVKGFIDEIQGFFNNMKAKLPEIKLPHFTVTYSVPKNKVGSVVWKDLMGLEGKPNIGVDWYAKAMNNAMVLNKPTIFGYSNGSFLGGGEAGSEVVSGANTLMGMIQSAVANEINNSPAVQLLQIIANNTGASTSIDINNREFARLVKGVV